MGMLQSIVNVEKNIESNMMTAGNLRPLQDTEDEKDDMDENDKDEKHKAKDLEPMKKTVKNIVKLSGVLKALPKTPVDLIFAQIDSYKIAVPCVFLARF